MSSSKKKVATELERTLSSEAVAELLEGMARGMRSSHVRVQGETSVVLHPGSVVRVKLEAKEKAEKGSLTLKMTWQTPLIAGPATLPIALPPTEAVAGVTQCETVAGVEQDDPTAAKEQAESELAAAGRDLPAAKPRKAAVGKKASVEKKPAVKRSLRKKRAS